jgi:hypothetical protein
MESVKHRRTLTTCYVAGLRVSEADLPERACPRRESNPDLRLGSLDGLSVSI